MLHPIEQLSPSWAPLLPASMIPGPPPVIMPNPAFAKRRAVSTAACYVGSSGLVRADPKIATECSARSRECSSSFTCSWGIGSVGLTS